MGFRKLSQEAETAVGRAVTLARARGDAEIEPLHLLLGALGSDRGLSTLHALGLDLAELEGSLGPAPGGSAEPEFTVEALAMLAAPIGPGVEPDLADWVRWSPTGR
ncbi:MAG: Clp protease N-terminal domain-containing protein [Candidatus Eremiobacterota bacterium]